MSKPITRGPQEIPTIPASSRSILLQDPKTRNKIERGVSGSMPSLSRVRPLLQSGSSIPSAPSSKKLDPSNTVRIHHVVHSPKTPMHQTSEKTRTVQRKVKTSIDCKSNPTGTGPGIPRDATPFSPTPSPQWFAHSTVEGSVKIHSSSVGLEPEIRKLSFAKKLIIFLVNERNDIFITSLLQDPSLSVQVVEKRLIVNYHEKAFEIDVTAQGKYTISGSGDPKSPQLLVFLPNRTVKTLT